MKVLAPAKINLTLEVLSRRPDGYHDIRSVLQTIALYDELTFEASDEIKLLVEGPLLGDDNLVLKAARLLKQAAGSKEGATIVLKKVIPVAAGLGGGSSDAAATVMALNVLWRLNWPREKLLDIAAAVGSDVPFFIYGGAALAQGKGEILKPLKPVTSCWVVLLRPRIAVPEKKTERLYQSLDEKDFTDGYHTVRMVQRLESEGHVADGLLFNAFEPKALAFFPELSEHRQRMMDAGAKKVNLAGSGPALYSLLHKEGEARKLYAKLLQGGLETYIVKTLNRD